MAVTIQSFGLNESPQIVSESDLTGTPVRDISGGVAGVVNAIEIDNSANGAATYFKGYDNGAPTVGTTDPDLVIMIPASVRRTVIFIDGFDFDSAFSFAGVTTGGTGGTTSPTSDAPAEVVAS